MIDSADKTLAELVREHTYPIAAFFVPRGGLTPSAEGHREGSAEVEA